MTKDSKKIQREKNSNRLGMTGFLLVILVFVSVFLSFLVFIFTMNVIIDNEVKNALMITSALSTDMIYAIKPEKESLENKEYQEAKEILRTIKDTHQKLNTIYIYKLDDNRLRYIVDSEQEGSSFYTYPGMLFNTEENIFYSPFIDKEAASFFEQLTKSRRILIPVADKEDNTIAVAVFDFRKGAFTRVASHNAIIVLLLMTVFSAMLLMTGNFSKKRKELAIHKLLIDEMKQGVALHEIILDNQNKPIDYRYLSVNPSFEEMTGLKADHIIGKRVLEILPDTEPYWIEAFGKVATQRVSLTIDNYSKALQKYFQVQAYSPKPFQFVTVINNITSNKMVEKQLQAEKVLLETTLISVGDGVITTDKDENVLILNKVAEMLTGWTQKEAYQKPLLMVFHTINEMTGKTNEKSISQVFRKGETFEFSENIILISKSGIEMPIEGIISPITENNSRINGAVLVFRDFSDRKKKQSEIEYLSFRDKLTGLYNRHYFDEEFNRIDTPRNYPLTIMMADVNGLKLINDAFGHQHGDELLIKFAEAIKTQSRADDIVARIGGDEFVFLLPKTDVPEIEKIINRLKNKINQESVCNIEISASFGYWTKNDELLEITSVLKRAEAIMYKNKLNESAAIKKKAIMTILETFHQKHSKEREHAYNVKAYCEKFAEALQFSQKEIEEIGLLGLIHSVGKINSGEGILSNRRHLDEEEQYEIKRHADIGYQILRSVAELAELAEYVLQHHERWDGGGYPRGLKGEEIALQARMLSICEAYDRMVNTSYRTPLSKEQAISQLVDNKGKQFEDYLVDVFINKVL